MVRKHRLAEMGFDVEEANQIVMKCDSLEEAANKLAEQGAHCPSLWQQIENLFTEDSASYRPGKYKIVCVGSGTKVNKNSRPEGTAMGACDAQRHNLELGDIVDIVEVQVVDDVGLVRGKMQDGGWINISSTSGNQAWAVRLSIAVQLTELGFTECQAAEAEKRCSTVEAAVEYLTSLQE